MPVAYIGVGSNIDPKSNVLAALRMLAENTYIVAVSMFYRTKAIGSPGSPEFYNGVVRVETDIPARVLKFGVLRAIEETLGRQREDDKFAPRTIDLDLLLYDDQVIQEPDLVIPDPEIAERDFVARPLLNLDPNLVMPDTGEGLENIVNAMPVSTISPLAGFTSKLLKELQIEPETH
jgi:dihydroneopterin aldolase/2-amino-4-hydroxy-6-hydroxymethyldihydropteridine diphosphokinase